MAASDPDSPSAQQQLPAHSGRKGSKKVRTGCITCKIRKVKCDEQKPFCNRCSRTGRKCDGYLDAKSMAQRRRRRDPDSTGSSASNSPSGMLSLLSSASASLTSLSLARFCEGVSDDERRAFYFFQHVTAPNLSGDFDGMFWGRLVLQICQTEPAVRHAVLAVSSLHEGVMEGTVAPYGNGGDRQAFALGQYNKAITCLLGEMKHVDEKPVVPLVTCVLFVCIEFMQSKDKESLIHLEQGRQILSRLEKRAGSGSPDIDIIKRHLVPMYMRLSITSFMFGGSPVVIPAPLKTIRELPASFESIDDVRYALYDFMDECLRFTQRSRPTKYSDDTTPEEMHALEKEQDYLLRKLARFNVAVSLYQALSPKDAPAGSLALMKVHMHTTYIWVSTALTRNETIYDEYLSTFSEIISLAGSFIDTLEARSSSKESSNGGKGPLTGCSPNAAQKQIVDSKPPNRGSTTSSSSSPVSTNFSFETQVIAPLYFVAVKCRHPLIRRTALRLLNRNPSRREYLWRANIWAAIAYTTIKLEEKYLDPDRVRALQAQSQGHYAQHQPHQQQSHQTHQQHAQAQSSHHHQQHQWPSPASSGSSASPPPLPFTAPSTNGTTPERIWASRLPDLPLPQGFRADMSSAEQQQQQQRSTTTSWYDGDTRAFSNDLDASTPASQTYLISGGAANPLEGLGLGLGSATSTGSLIDPNLMALDCVSTDDAYSIASSFDDLAVTAGAVSAIPALVDASSGPAVDVGRAAIFVGAAQQQPPPAPQSLRPVVANPASIPRSAGGMAGLPPHLTHGHGHGHGLQPQVQAQPQAQAQARAYSHPPQAVGAWPRPAVAPTLMARSVSSAPRVLTASQQMQVQHAQYPQQQQQQVANASASSTSSSKRVPHRFRQLHNTYHSRWPRSHGQQQQGQGDEMRYRDDDDEDEEDEDAEGEEEDEDEEDDDGDRSVGLGYPHQQQQQHRDKRSQGHGRRRYATSKFRRSTEPPYDLPEWVRVHEAIIGPEKEDGSWIMVFRKLEGLQGDWDVQTEYVAAVR